MGPPAKRLPGHKTSAAGSNPHLPCLPFEPVDSRDRNAIDGCTATLAFSRTQAASIASWSSLFCSSCESVFHVEKLFADQRRVVALQSKTIFTARLSMFNVTQFDV